MEGFQFFAWRLEVVTWGKNGNMDNHTDVTHNDWVMFFRQKCWLVVEPRSLAATHNPCACRNIGTSFNGCKLLGNILRFGELRPSLLGRCPSSKTMFFFINIICYVIKINYTRDEIFAKCGTMNLKHTFRWRWWSWWMVIGHAKKKHDGLQPVTMVSWQCHGLVIQQFSPLKRTLSFCKNKIVRHTCFLPHMFRIGLHRQPATDNKKMSR